MTEAHVRQDQGAVFDRDGVVCVRGLIGHEWIERLRNAVQYVLENPGAHSSNQAEAAGRKGRFFGENSLWQRYPEFEAFARESPLARTAAEVMRSSTVRLYNDVIFVKEPGTDVPTPWHHDLPYFRIQGMQTCSAWVALDVVTANSGALSYVAGSHKWGSLFYPIDFAQESNLTDGGSEQMETIPDIDAERDRYRIVSFDLEPGDVTFHNLLTIHGAGGNTSVERRRRAVSVRMCGDDVVWRNRPYATADFDVDLHDGDPLRGVPFPQLWPPV